jgi:hypothetical protein
MQQAWTLETVCDRCGKLAKNGGYCPECEENLCEECAHWIQSGTYWICRACKEEADLPKGTYVPYHLYLYSFGEALAVSVVTAKDKLSQAKWRTLSLEQQETILDEWENNETIKKAWARLHEAYRRAVASKKQVAQEE